MPETLNCVDLHFKRRVTRRKEVVQNTVVSNEEETTSLYKQGILHLEGAWICSWILRRLHQFDIRQAMEILIQYKFLSILYDWFYVKITVISGRLMLK